MKIIEDTCSLLTEIERDEPDSEKRKHLADLADCFISVYELLSQKYDLVLHEVTLRTTKCEVLRDGQPGRPKFHIPKEVLEELRGMNFTWDKIAEMLGVSRWTVGRRVDEYDLKGLQGFSDISDERIDEIVSEYIEKHGSTTGEPFMTGYFRSIGLNIQRRRIRASLKRVDPRNSALRWGLLIYRRRYYVPWPNSLWHVDGHHSLIRWKFVIHGCCDGFSRKIMFLSCNTNNLASTVRDCFQQSIQENCGLWPSRIRVDHGVENVLICDLMVEKRGEGRGSFIAGPSTRNQRIERLWRDVFRCVAHFFYYHFYAMELCGVLNLENPVHLFALHVVYKVRINSALLEFKEMFNNHRLSTEKNKTPNQLWLEGMLDPVNPLSKDDIEPDQHVDEFYGEDPQGPRSRNSNNNVVVEELEIENQDELLHYVRSNIDLNRESRDAGIDIYLEVVNILNSLE